MAEDVPAQRSTRGALIVVEGLDRAGKSTQVERLAARWSQETGHPAKAIRFPDRTTPIGESLNTYLTKTGPGKALPLAAAHLLFSANRWEAASTLLESLEAGNTLIVDRYSYSGAVYTAAKASIAPDAADRNMTLDWTWAPEIGLPAPDLLLFLDIDEEEAERRGGFGGERYETTDMQRAVRRVFYELLQRLQSRREQTGTNITRVNANQEMEQVSEDVWNAVEDLRQETGGGALTDIRTLQSLPGAALASE